MAKLGFWEDDALVCSEIIEKFWADIQARKCRFCPLLDMDKYCKKCERVKPIEKYELWMAYAMVNDLVMEALERENEL